VLGLEAELMGAATEKAAADLLSAAGWGRLQEVGELADSLLGMPFFVALSLQRQMLTKKVIKSSWKFGKFGQHILRTFRSQGVLQASVKFELPPLAVFGYCLAREPGMSHDTAKVALSEPETHLSGNTLCEFHAARRADGVTQTMMEDVRTHDRAVAFECAVKARLTEGGVAFLTEDDQKREAAAVGSRPQATPDFLIRGDVPLYIGAAEVRWIEVKNFFGSALGYHRSPMSKQFEKYRRLYGPGAVVFSLGAGESIRQVLPLDVIVIMLTGL